MLFALIAAALGGFGIYRFLIWGTSGAPTDQTPGFDPILLTTTRNFVEDDRGIVGPSPADAEAVNPDQDPPGNMDS